MGSLIWKHFLLSTFILPSEAHCFNTATPLSCFFFFIKSLCMKYVKNYYLSFFFQTGHVTRHAVSLSHGNKLISFSFGDSAWATRKPEDYTNQTKRRWKEVTMSWTISKFFIFWVFFHKNINIHVNGNLIWMTTFLRFWISCSLCHVSDNFLFLCHFSCKCWLVQKLCVLV